MLAVGPRTGSALLAQVNVALLRAPLDASGMAGFAAAFDPVNRVAERSPGFVWRLQDGGHAPVVEDGAGLWFVNVSLWRSYEDLHAFTYRSQHGALLRHRARWCRPTPPPSTALWWVADDDRPDAAEGRRRLAVLRSQGPTPQAFGPRRRFDARGRPEGRRRPGVSGG